MSGLNAVLKMSTRAIYQRVQSASASADLIEGKYLALICLCMQQCVRWKNSLDFSQRLLMLARGTINLLYRPSLTRLQLALPQLERRNLDAHRRIFKAIAARDADQAPEWTRKHLIDFQRGYLLAKIPMNRPIETHHLE